MTELDIMKRAKMYMDRLACGIDPVSGTPLPDDTVLNGERLAKCFAYVAGVLGQVIDNGGQVTSRFYGRAPFSITPEQCALVELSDEPAGITDIGRRINEVIDIRRTTEVSTVKISNWLIDEGYLEFAEGTGQRVPTEKGASLGIVSVAQPTPEGGSINLTLYSREAQRFIINSVNGIYHPAD